MQVKTIEQVCRAVIENWVESIKDSNLVNLIKKNTIITGGAIASMLMREDVNDFDVYFRDYLTTLKKVFDE